jgi:hypothetical protein
VEITEARPGASGPFGFEEKTLITEVLVQDCEMASSVHTGDYHHKHGPRSLDLGELSLARIRSAYDVVITGSDDEI